MDKALKIAVILTAIDNMSNVVNGAVNKSINSLEKFKPALSKVAQGAAMVGAGMAGMNLLKPAVQTFADYQQAAANLKSNLMDRNGFLDPALWQRVNSEAVNLGNLLPGNTADFYQMFDTLKALGVNTTDIIGGVAKSAAYLSLVTNESYQSTADAAGRMMNATGIAAKDMMGFFDTVARAQKVGVSLGDMKDAFANSAGQLKFLKIQGLEATQSLTGFFATMIRNGNTGQRVGTAFNRIMSEMTNPNHYKAMQDAAHKYGISLDILDKKGNFTTVENMIAQFQKLNTLNNFQVSNILKPLTGGTGFDDQIIKALSKDGIAYADVLSKMANQATLNTKAQTQLLTIKNQWERFSGTMDNVKAAFGESLQKPIDRVLELLNKVAEAVLRFVSANPKIAETIGLLVAFSSAGLMLAGVIKVVQGVTLAFRLLNITLLTGPVGWVVGIVAILAVAALLVYKYWTPISGFFKRLWQGIKNVTSVAWNAIKTIFLNATPIGWAMQAWGPLIKFFTNLWNQAKAIFTQAWQWIMNTGSKFYNAGKNIITSLWRGIKAVIMWPINEIKKMIDLVQKYTGFHFGGGSSGGAGASGTWANAGNHQPSYASTRSTSNNTVNYSPVIHLGSGITSADTALINKMNETNLEQLLKRIQDKQKRVAF